MKFFTLGIVVVLLFVQSAIAQTQQQIEFRNACIADQQAVTASKANADSQYDDMDTQWASMQSARENAIDTTAGDVDRDTGLDHEAYAYVKDALGLQFKNTGDAAFATAESKWNAGDFNGAIGYYGTAESAYEVSWGYYNEAHDEFETAMSYYYDAEMHYLYDV